MAEGRLARFAGGLGLGYLHTLAVLVVGLWLTPFLLRQLGSHDYGLWLLASQVLVYLALMDLGVVALVPREVAFAAGQQRRHGADGTCGPSADVGGAIGRTMALRRLADAARRARGGRGGVAVAGRMGAAAPPVRDRRGGVRGDVSAARVYGTPPLGLQDLTFLGAIQLAAWAAGMATTVGPGVSAGAGLYALAAGWAALWTPPALVALRRVMREFSLTPSLSRPDPAVMGRACGRSIQRGTWISLTRSRKSFCNGTDLLVLGTLLGPAATVPQACTGKLITCSPIIRNSSCRWRCRR